MSKVKTFNQKQRPLTGAEAKALEHLKKKKAGVKTKQAVISPEHGNLKDDTFKPIVDPDEKYKGKIITEEDLKKEKEEELQVSKDYEEEFFKQYAEWKKIDESSEYDWCTFDNDDYLVRLFAMDVSGFDKYKSLKYEWSSILKNWKLTDTQLIDNVYPIGKILKVGKAVELDKYKVGDIVLLPSNDIVGEDWNPHFLTILGHQRSQGMSPVLPTGMRQRMQNVELKWDRYKFVRPWVPKPEDKDNLTFLIPSPIVKGTYDL